MFFLFGILILNEYHFIENIFTLKPCFPLYIYSKDTIVPDFEVIVYTMRVFVKLPLGIINKISLSLDLIYIIGL